jgi:hypothetical protein
MDEGAAVAAVARTGSSAGLAKSPWRGIGRRLSWSSKILRNGLNRPTSGHRRPFPHIRSAILKASQPRMAIPTPQKSMTETTASSHFLHGVYGLRRRMASNKLFVRLSVERRLSFSTLGRGPHRRGRFEPTGVTPPFAAKCNYTPAIAATRHHYAAGPSVGTRFLDNLLCFSRLVRWRMAPALPDCEAAAGPHFLRSELAL